ncbi:MAG: hypothetical protein Q9170_001873 [Blastenia crenularia]
MEAVGVIGLAVQVADVGGRTLLGMIKLLKDLKETPKQMAELFEDVEKSVQRICSLREVLQQPTTLSTQMSSTQIQRINATTDDAYQAMCELRQTLEPLFQKSSLTAQGFVKRAWRSLSTRIQRNLEAREASTAAQLNSLNASSREIQQAAQATHSKVTQLQPKISEMNGIFRQLEALLKTLTGDVHQINNTTRSLQADSRNVNAYMSTENNPKTHGNDTTTKFCISLAKVGLLGTLKENLYHPNVADHLPIVAGQSFAPQIVGSSGVELAMQARRQLIRSPDLLHDVCEGVNAGVHCNCKPVRKRQTYWMGRFSFTTEFSTPHTVQCPYYKRHRKSWKYSLSAQMLPVLQSAICTTFAATLGAGGCSVGPSLRYFGVVQRSKSPAYQLFDVFPDLCARKFYLRGPIDERESPKGQYINFEVGSDHRPFRFIWDLELVKVELSNLTRNLSLLLSAGHVSASCTDEMGNTLLHALLVLIGSLGSKAECVIDELKLLARMVIAAGVDADAASRNMAVNYYSQFLQSSIVMKTLSTVCEVATLMPLEVPGVMSSIPLYEDLEEFLDGEEAESSPGSVSRPRYLYAQERKTYLLLLRRYPSLISFWGYGSLEQSIIGRSLAQMNRILQTWQPESPYFAEDYNFKLSPLELAVGWPEGLKRLLDLGHNVTDALCLSIHMEDFVSTNLLLGADHFPGDDRVGWSCAFLQMLKSENPQMQDLIIENLAQRRRSLADSTIRELLADDLLDLGLSSKRTISSKALTVYRRLQEGCVHIPQSLVPWSGFSEPCTVFQFVCNDSHHDRILPTPRLLDSLFESGFDSIDASIGIGKTPLLLVLDGWIKLFDLTEAQLELSYRIICRLEVFDRLGMTHTCCRLDCKGDRVCVPRSEQMQLQDEDIELKQQLDLILKAYEQSCRRYGGSITDFWKLWWHRLDEILPDLASEQRCGSRCMYYGPYTVYKDSKDYLQKETELHQRRAEVEEEALAKMGYSGLDFIDVIKFHFADVLDVATPVSSAESQTFSSRPFRGRSRANHGHTFRQLSQVTPNVPFGVQHRSMNKSTNQNYTMSTLEHWELLIDDFDTRSGLTRLEKKRDIALARQADMERVDGQLQES